MTRFDRFAFVIFFLLSVGAGILGVYFALTGWINAAKWVGTAGLLATVTGVVQLEVSGLFEQIAEYYSNEEKYPYGPPSNITRQIIDNPNTPIRTWIRNTCFFNTRTGFWFIVLGTLIQAFALWI